MDKAFTKGLLVIEAPARSVALRGISSLAGELRLTKSNVHRLLVTSMAHRYVRQQGSDSASSLRAAARDGAPAAGQGRPAWKVRR